MSNHPREKMPSQAVVVCEDIVYNVKKDWYQYGCGAIEPCRSPPEHGIQKTCSKCKMGDVRIRYGESTDMRVCNCAKCDGRFHFPKAGTRWTYCDKKELLYHEPQFLGRVHGCGRYYWCDNDGIETK